MRLQFDYSLSSLYAKDVGETPLAIVPYYPTSANSRMFPIHIHGSPDYIEEDLIGLRTAFSVGEGVEVRGKVAPDMAVVECWNRYVACPPKFNVGAEKFDDGVKYIVLFPHEHLLHNQYLIDPFKHYELLGKEALIRSAVCQPHSIVIAADERLINALRLPVAIKASHGSGGFGTWLVRSEEEREAALRVIKHRKFECLVVCDYIEDSIANYCLHFYLSKCASNDVFLGVTRQTVDENGGWEGAFINYEEQEELEAKLKPIMQHIGAFLRNEGYFGIVGIDVLEDKTGALFVIDLNPRVNGSTSLCLTKTHLMQLGKPLSYMSRFTFIGISPEELVKALEGLVSCGRVILLGAVKFDNNTTAFLAMNGKNKEEVEEIELHIRSINDLTPRESVQVSPVEK